MKRALIVVAVAGLLLPLVPSRAVAHTQSFGLGGHRIAIRTGKSPDRQTFLFKSARELPFLPASPAIWGSWLLVEGQGANAGKTELIQLDDQLWKSKGPRGYSYKDRDGTRGGATRVVIRPGFFKVAARGAAWSWDVLGPQDQVGVHLRIGQEGETEYEWLCSLFGGEIRRNEVGLFKAKDSPKVVSCPTVVCGNGELELGEECDDGNNDQADGCLIDCTLGECIGDSYDTTFEALQAVVFDNPVYGPCSNAVCHGSVIQQGNLQLTDGVSHSQLVNVPATGNLGILDRVEPGEKDLSILWEKLEARVNGTLTSFGSPMPSSGAPLTADHLEAVRLWIQGGAPEDGIVAGTAELLGGCLPEPTPLTIPPPDPPANGAQLWSNPWDLVSQSENEVCFATYYDLDGLVPAESIVDCTNVCANGVLQPCTTNADCGGAECIAGSTNNPGGECFLYHSQTIYQDPQSHHAFVRIYLGVSDTTDPDWGPWSYKFADQSNPLQGQQCDPLNVDPLLGYNPGCSSETQEGIACLGTGPADLSNGSSQGLTGSGTTPTFSGAGVPVFEQSFPDGVYSTLPTQGIIVWNSHAFNLTSQDTTMSIYQNLDYAGPLDQTYQVTPIFEDVAIFVQDVPPFQTAEYCRTWTAPQGSRIFLLTSHTHQWGVQWRTWGPPNVPCSAPGGQSCGTPRGDTPLYVSTDYSDPLNQFFFGDDEIELDSADPDDRTFLFCSLYDNGSTPTSPPVKRQSTAVDPPLLLGLPIGPGGPCSDNEVACFNDGPNKGQLCGNEADPVAFCESSPGAADGVCDACPVEGGVTTTDEMFILQGAYYVVPPGP